MKLTDKRLWWFEGIMLICGILSSYLYALNFGICISQIPSLVVFYTLSCLLGSIIAWKVYKNNGVWKLLCYVFLFSTIIYCTIDMILRVVYPNPYGNLFMLFANGLFYWCLCSIFPIIILVFGAKRILRL